MSTVSTLPLVYVYRGQLHREDGPAVIYLDNKTEFWFIFGREITENVRQWMRDFNLPSWQEWTDDIWVLFKLTFL